jgi:hypothetical protein
MHARTKYQCYLAKTSLLNTSHLSVYYEIPINIGYYNAWRHTSLKELQFVCNSDAAEQTDHSALTDK